MRRGFERPTSSSTSRSFGTAFQQPRRTRQGRNDISPQADSSTRRDPLNQPNLTLPQQSSDIASIPPERKSPAYLEGRNPYGQFLDNADHSSRRIKALGGAPSQIGATPEGRPRTSGSFQFKTRPDADANAEHKQEVTTPKVSPSLVSVRTQPKPVSVQAVKEMFESKLSQYSSTPLLPPPQPATSKDLDVREQSPLQPYSPFAAKVPQSTDTYDMHASDEARNDSVPRLIAPCPPSNRSSGVTHAYVANPFAPPEPKSSPPHITVSNAARPRDDNDDASFGQLEKFPSRRRSTNIFITAAQDTEVLVQKRHPFNNKPRFDEAFVTPQIVLERADRPNQAKSTVRRPDSRDTVSAAESDQGASEAMQPAQSRVTCAKFGGDVREPPKGDYKATARRRRKRKPCTLLMDERPHTHHEPEPGYLGSSEYSRTDTDQV